jgi:16S rRNA C1402 N4-methylase RsmH
LSSEIDRDLTAIREAEKNPFPIWGEDQARARELQKYRAILDELGISAVDGMLFDSACRLRSWMKTNAGFPI